MSKSIIPGGNDKKCWICDRMGYETIHNLHKHHIIYGKEDNRKLSEHYGLHVRLCMTHHEDHKEGVHHGNTHWNTVLKQTAQEAFEEKKGTREDFIRIFGKSYL